MQLEPRSDHPAALVAVIKARRLRMAVVAVLMLAGAALLAARPGTQLPQPKFSSGVDLVALDVCVKDRDGRFIPGLTADEFLVLDNNRLRTIEFFSADGRVPLTVVMLVDRSASMADGKLERAKAAARTFIQALRPGDLLEVITFGDRSERRLAFSTDRAAAEQAIDELSAEGATALFESLAIALRDLEQARRRQAIDYRQAIIILSDGEDTRSVLTFDDLLEDARRSGVLIYGLSLRADEKGRALPTPRTLLQLAHDTGGRAVAVEDRETLGAVYEEIGAELRHLYRVAFAPAANTPHDGSWRRISVRVRDHGDVRVRTRAGYYAPRKPARIRQGLQP